MTGKRRGEFRYWNQVWALWYARGGHSRIDTSGQLYSDAHPADVDMWCRRRNNV